MPPFPDGRIEEFRQFTAAMIHLDDRRTDEVGTFLSAASAGVIAVTGCALGIEDPPLALDSRLVEASAGSGVMSMGPEAADVKSCPRVRLMRCADANGAKAARSYRHDQSELRR